VTDEESARENDQKIVVAGAYGLSGLVLQDLVDLGHDLGGQLGQDLEGLAVVSNLLGLGSSENTGGDVLVLEIGRRRQCAFSYWGSTGERLTLMAQAKAKWVMVQSNSFSAISVNFLTFWILA